MLLLRRARAAVIALASALAGFAAPALAQETAMDADAPVYMIVQIQIEDAETFWNDYVPGVMPIHDRHGVEIIVGAPDVEVLEGRYDRNFTVVLKFPNAKAQRAWYADPDYQPLKALRQRITADASSWMIVAPQFQGLGG